MLQRNFVQFSLVLLLAGAMGCGDTVPDTATPATSQSSPSAAPAEAVVDAMAAGDWAASVANFDATMAGAMSSAQMQALWGQISAGKGAFKARGETAMSKEGAYEIAVVTCEFERGTQKIQITIDGNGKVAGLFLR